jgi:hypothetical protein
MAGVRLKPPVRLHPINGIEGIEHAQEPGYIWLISRGNDFQSERTHRSAIQNSRQPPHNGKLHAPFYEGLAKLSEVVGIKQNRLILFGRGPSRS